ncbi:hypothetical protein DFR24_0245 [Panacagrimonas perspica]|uniref:Uncharacterized protein n=1 Tax=Panacagrimonas perspica TaxID=381431 RepID=A0A4R7PAE4_9GAMM|nr:hypothetical protein [Panacagrimonas perspica]TDU30888.1 hypothetical protein DFR24_0245 [Panacagrimonas perspica]THD01955.1 hypothetical protein B1810_18345 [Panacagrimonas perspica]
MRKILAAVTFLAATLSGSANAMSASASGVFVAVDDAGQPTEKVLRVSHTPVGWKFEDRQPDGSWLDVSCHGGCEHRESAPEDLEEFFGGPPPNDIKPECVQNEQYAFCHFLKTAPGAEREGFVLVVRIAADWLPVSMIRLPGPPQDGDDEDDDDGGKAPTPKLESARYTH